MIDEQDEVRKLAEGIDEVRCPVCDTIIVVPIDHPTKDIYCPECKVRIDDIDGIPRIKEIIK